MCNISICSVHWNLPVSCYQQDTVIKVTQCGYSLMNIMNKRVIHSCMICLLKFFILVHMNSQLESSENSPINSNDSLMGMRENVKVTNKDFRPIVSVMGAIKKKFCLNRSV